MSSIKIIEDLLSESGLQCQGSIVHFNPDEIKALKEAVQTLNELEKLRDAYGVAMQEINKLRKEIKQLKKKRSEMND